MGKVAMTLPFSHRPNLLLLGLSLGDIEEDYRINIKAKKRGGVRS
jgi:uncharacterized membrane protein